jgi:hypothetical protein
VTTVFGKVGSAGTTDGVGAEARFGRSGLGNPWSGGMVIDAKTDPAHPLMYVSDSANQTIRSLDLATNEVKIDLTTKNVVTVAGKAPASPYQFCELISVVLPPECGWIDATRGLDARFRFPFGVAPDQKGGFFIVDSHNDVIRRFDMASTAVSTVAGVQMEILDDVPHASDESTPAQYGTFWHPTNVAFAAPNVLYVSDRSANCIRRVELGAAPAAAGP